MKKLLLLAFLALITVQGFSQGQTMAPLPNHGSVFTGNIRGYWFTAPTCFTITGLRVPTEASTAGQTIAVVRFDNQTAPPLWSTTTDDFEVLYYVVDTVTTDTLDVAIPVCNGDVIGVLGWRGTSNSYAGAPYTSSIAGMPVTFTRLGMQFNLNTTAPQQLFQEANGSLSRTEMYYDTAAFVSPTPNGSFTEVDNGGGSFTFTPSFAASSCPDVSWDFGDGNTDTTHAPTHVYATTGFYVVTMSYTNNCGQTISYQTTVGICSAPTAGFTVTGGGNTFDFNDTTTVNGTGSYQWDFGDGNTATGDTVQHTYGASGTYIVSLIVTDPCGSDTIVDTVSACVVPQAAFTFNDNGNGNFFFIDGSTIDNTPGYLWDFGDGNTDTIPTVGYTYAAPGDYVVCLTASNSCSSATICDTINVCLPPVAGFAPTTSEGTLTVGDNSNWADNYSWDFGDGNTGTGATPSQTYSNGGTYTICLTVTNACGTDSVCEDVTVTITGINDLTAPGVEVNVFPNPSSEVANVQLEGIQLSAGATLSTYGMDGRLISTTAAGSGNLFEVAVADMATGQYLFRVIDEGKVIATGRIDVK